MNNVTRQPRRYGRVAATAALVLSAVLALAGCSSAPPADHVAADHVAADPSPHITTIDELKAGASNPSADGSRLGSGSHQTTFQVINNSGYRMAQSFTDGKITGTSAQVLSTTPTTVSLTDDSSPTDQGDVTYSIWDYSDPTDGKYMGQVIVTFIDNWYNGKSMKVSYEDMPAGTISQSGDNTNGSTTLNFFNGSCGTAFAKGAYSIDQTIYNATPYTMTLVNDVQYTNSTYGSFNTRPPATIAPGGCAEMNGYTSSLMGFSMTATYTFVTPTGTQWAQFSNGMTSVTPDGGGLTENSGVYSAVPQLSGLGWDGTHSTTFRAVDSNVSPSTYDHPHVSTTITAMN